MGKKRTESKKVARPKRSKSKSTTPKTTSQPQPQPPKPVDTATATVQRIFSGAKNKFLTKLENDPESNAVGSSVGGSSSSSTLPKASDPAADHPLSPTQTHDPDEDSSASGDSASESANLSDLDENAFSDLDENAFSQVGSASESDSDSGSDGEEQASAPAAQSKALPSTSKSDGKGKEKEGSSSKNSKDATTSKPSKACKLARWGQLVFVPVVPVVLPGNKLPMLPLPTPHEVSSLRFAGLGAVPPTGQTTFGISKDASSDKLDRYFKKILPTPFKAMGKKAKYHLMYSHGSTLGCCGTASPNGFDVATAYRAGKAHSMKVFFIAPAEPIPAAQIKSWELDAVVEAINRRLQVHSRKRKRSANDGSESEENSDESDWASEDGTDSGENGTLVLDGDASAMNSTEVGLEEESPEPQITLPPRKKVKRSTTQSSSDASDSATPSNDIAGLESASSVPGRVLRERNRPTISSDSVSKPIDPLNPWLNASSYTL